MKEQKDKPEEESKQKRKGPVLSKEDQKIVDQNERPLKEVIKQLNYQPVNRRIILSPVPSTLVTRTGVILTANTTDPNPGGLDFADFYQTILAIDVKTAEQAPYKVGDKILANLSQARQFTINDIIVNEVQEHQVFGYSLGE